MPAYWIVRVEVTDPSRFAEYATQMPQLLGKYGARHLVRGGETVSLEGPPETRRVVVIEFPSLELAEQCYRSPEYQQLRTFRLGAATGEIIAVAGVA